MPALITVSSSLGMQTHSLVLILQIISTLLELSFIFYVPVYHRYQSAARFFMPAISSLGTRKPPQLTVYPALA
ncbi:hypothetical protein FPQ18DRAFT_313451 [Pyronema domesticum]|nr:hypothetical protein FPQ18DRAFT_313451 [Pyronema domesticum]